MNYILQVKAFNKLHLRDPFSKGQFMLFHALLDVNNDCGWLEWFDVALSRLELFSRLSREGVQKARAELLERGLIEFKSNGTRAGSYRLKKLYEDSTQVSTQTSTQDSTQISTQDSTQISTQRVTKKERLNADLTTEKAENTQISTQVSTQISTQESTPNSTQESTSLNKQNKTKQNKTKDMVSGSSYASESFDPNGEQPKDVFDFYEENFGEPSKIVAKDLNEMSKQFGDELVIEALKQAGFYNGKYGYAKTILERWANEGIDSLEKVQAERAKFVKSSEKKVSSYPRTGRIAPVPDYITNPNETKETKLSPEEEQKLREEINSLRSVGK
jgi:DnaD/phage-associated family protein